MKSKDSSADHRLTTKTVIFDVTRLIRRAHLSAPTGIDRIERFYAQYWLGRSDVGTRFEAWLPGMGWLSLPEDTVRAMLDSPKMAWPAMLKLLRQARPAGGSDDPDGSIYLTVSHNRPTAVKAWRKRADRKGGRLIYFIHDLIPITHPEYARAEHAELNRRRMDTALSCSNGIIVNSRATQNSLTAYAGSGPARPILIAPFGMTLKQAATDFSGSGSDLPARPYFLCLGTIEPRKNHLMLLHIWRDLAEKMQPEDMPLLILTGRRGWENENIIDMLDRCTAIKDHVMEKQDVSDGELAQLMQNARALLMPSFTEGFGLPVAEALHQNCPVIASDIAAHLEVGSEAPLYIDPLDAAAWRSAILDFASDTSNARQAHIDAAKKWQPHEWTAHFDAICEFMEML